MWIPPGLAAQRRLGPEWSDWLDRLPRLLEELLVDWELDLDGLSLHGFVALVQPVRTAEGRAAVLKVSCPQPETEHEHLALQRWGGRGAVELLRADPRRRALLLERLGPGSLEDVWDLAACEEVAQRYAALHVPALPQLRPLTAYLATWLDALAELPRSAPLPPRMVQQALSLGRDLLTDRDTTGTMVHGDLHYENVLEGAREPWLVIDPQPVSGDAHYEPAPMLWNRFGELTGDLREGLRRRFHTLVDVAGLDEARARDWVVVRVVLNAHWAIQDAERAGRVLVAEEREWITRCVSVTKAVQD